MPNRFLGVSTRAIKLHLSPEVQCHVNRRARSTCSSPQLAVMSGISKREERIAWVGDMGEGDAGSPATQLRSLRDASSSWQRRKWVERVATQRPLGVPRSKGGIRRSMPVICHCGIDMIPLESHPKVLEPDERR